MHWLKDNVYIAAWLALPITLMVAVIQGRSGKAVDNGGHREAWPMKKVLVYLIFLICFPMTMSPWVDEPTRWVCGLLSVGFFISIISTTDRQWLDKENEKTPRT